MNFAIKPDFSARAGLAELLSALGEGSGRTAMHHSMGESVRELVRGHLQALAGSRHDTANRLGAAPSGHWEKGAQAVERAALEADAKGASLVINHPGLARAFRDVTIRPVAAKALAIPVAALAYNRSPRQFGPSALFLFQSQTTGNTFLAKRTENAGEAPELLYLLVRSVTQKQDRSLLPSDQELGEAALDGASSWLAQQMSLT